MVGLKRVHIPPVSSLRRSTMLVYQGSRHRSRLFTMSHTLSNVTVDLSRTYGQIFISAILTTAFWGMSGLQLLFYLSTYSSDHWAIKAYVLLLFLLSSLHEIFGIRGIWTLLVPRYSDLVVLGNTSPDLLLAIPVSCLVGVMAQGFFIWRIWRFSHGNWIFPIILVPLSLWGLIASIVSTFKSWNHKLSVFSQPDMVRLALSIQITVTVIDVLLAAIMTFLLLRGATGLQKSNTLLVRLIYAAITTGTCTAIFGFIGAVTLAWPHDLFYTLGANTICSVYCNTVLANLNARKYIGTIENAQPTLTDVVFNRPIELASVHPTGTSRRSGTDGGVIESKNETT